MRSGYHNRDRVEVLDGGIYRLMAQNNPEFPRDSLWDLYNMVYEKSSGDPEKAQGYTQLGTNTVADAVSGLFDYIEGTELIACSENGGVYKRTTGDWSTVSGGGAGTFSTTDDVRWTGQMTFGATTSSRLLVISNGVNAPQKYTSGAGISALGGSPPSTGKYLSSFAGRYWLVTGDTLHYSAADNVENWSGGGSFQVDYGTGDITGLYVFGSQMLIFKRNKILRYVAGDSLASASILDVTNAAGTPSHHTIQETTGNLRSGSLLFMSDEGIHELRPTQATGAFYVTNTAENIKPILDNRDERYFSTCWATYNAPRGEYWLQYGISNARPDEGVIGNMAQRKARWTTHDMRTKTAGTMYLSSGKRIQVIGDGSGNVYQLHDESYNRDGAGYRGFVTTPAYAQQDRARMKVYGRTFLDAATNGTYPILSYETLGRSALPAPAGSTNSPSGFGAVDGWGTGEWGEAVWGGYTTQGQWFRPSSVRRGAWKRMRFETLGADQWFRVYGLAMEYSYRRAILAA